MVIIKLQQTKQMSNKVGDHRSGSPRLALRVSRAFCWGGSGNVQALRRKQFNSNREKMKIGRRMRDVDLPESNSTDTKN